VLALAMYMYLCVSCHVAAKQHLINKLHLTCQKPDHCPQLQLFLLIESNLLVTKSFKDKIKHQLENMNKKPSTCMHAMHKLVGLQKTVIMKIKQQSLALNISIGMCKGSVHYT